MKKRLIAFLLVLCMTVGYLPLAALAEEESPCTHADMETVNNPATCEESGYHTYYYCPDCTGVFKDAEGNTPTTLEDEKVDALGHNYGEDGICPLCKQVRSVNGVFVVDGKDGVTEVTAPVVGQVLAANVQTTTGVIYDYPLNKKVHYKWTLDGDDVGSESRYTVTEDNVGKKLDVTVSVDGYAGEQSWNAAGEVTYGAVTDVFVVDGKDGVTKVDSPVVGQVLVANVQTTTGVIYDDPLNEKVHYTWRIGENEVGNESRYTVTEDNVGKKLTVTVTVDNYKDEKSWSASNDVQLKEVTGVCVVDGKDGVTEVTSPVAGQILVANVQTNTGVIYGDPLNEKVHYTWRIGENEVGNESRYTVTADNVGKTLSVTVSVEGYEKTATWTADASVVNKVTGVTVVDSKDGVTKVDSPVVGQVLAANIETLTETIYGDPLNGKAHYSWTIGDTAVGAEPYYTVTEDNVGKKLAVTVTVDGYEGEQSWAAAGEVTYGAVTGVSVVDGKDGVTEVTAPVVGQVLAANVQTTTGVIYDYPLNEKVHYTWTLDGNAVGSESRYTVTEDNIGKKLAVTVTVDGYKGEAAWTADIANLVNVKVTTLFYDGRNPEGDPEVTYVQAEAGKPFTYEVPKVEGYTFWAAASVIDVEEVAADGTSEVSVLYKKNVPTDGVYDYLGENLRVQVTCSNKYHAGDKTEIVDPLNHEISYNVEFKGNQAAVSFLKSDIVNAAFGSGHEIEGNLEFTLTWNLTDEEAMTGEWTGLEGEIDAEIVVECDAEAPANKYTITYTDGVDGEVIFEDIVFKNVEEGSVTPKPADPTRKGYIFTGWQLVTKMRAASGVAEKVTGEATYAATWTEDANGNGKADASEPHYTVIYNDGDPLKGIFATQTYRNILVGMPTPEFQGTPTRSGYEFTGWEPEVEDTVTKSVTYKATWKKIVTYVTVTFIDRGEEVDTITLEKGEEIGNKNMPEVSRKGYALRWYTQKNGKGSRFRGTTNVYEDTTVYANWVKSDGTNAKTGDTIMAWVTVMGVAALGIAGVAVYCIKRKKK